MPSRFILITRLLPTFYLFYFSLNIIHIIISKIGIKIFSNNPSYFSQPMCNIFIINKFSGFFKVRIQQFIINNVLLYTIEIIPCNILK